MPGVSGMFVGDVAGYLIRKEGGSKWRKRSLCETSRMRMWGR